VKVFFKYLRKNWLVSSLLIYEFIAVILHAIGIAEIGIPCLFTLIFGVHCWGCGMTHAVIALFKLDFQDAWNENQYNVTNEIQWVRDAPKGYSAA
jgi:hypothetical protein